MKLFFDSSVFAKRYILEQGSEKVDELCAEASLLAISIICVPEILSALARLKRETKLTLGQYKACKESLLKDIEDAIICLLTPAVIGLSYHIIEANSVRAMDALHIACACEWQADFFISSDKQQLVAAKRSGLEVLNVS